MSLPRPRGAPRHPRRLVVALLATAAAALAGLATPGDVPVEAEVSDLAVEDVGGPVRPASVRPVKALAPAPTDPMPPPAAPAVPLADPYRDQQWHLDRLGLDGVRVVPDGTGQVIAVLDSGVDLAHPDLRDVLVRDDNGRVVGLDVVDGDDVPQDEFGHGTMVAGVAAGQSGNGLGVAGVVSGGVRILPVRVLDDAGRGSATRVARGLDWAVDHGATVANLSLESAGVAALRDDPALDAALDRALAAGIAVVVAAGNGDEVTDPADDPETDAGLVVVGATDRDDARAGFSDRGRTDLLMAPGVEIVSTWCRAEDLPPEESCDGETHTYGIADGTSFAAPQVSGLVAMLASTGMGSHAALARLAATAQDLGPTGPDVATGRGLVAVGPALGNWPRRSVPATTPREAAARGTVTTAPTTAPQAVVGATPPDRTAPLLVRIAVAVALVAAVGIVGYGLVSGAAGRARDRDVLADPLADNDHGG